MKREFHARFYKKLKGQFLGLTNFFADTVAGARANAIYYSLIESAKANNLNIYKYINYLLNKLPQLETEQTEEQIEKYLPWSKELLDEILNYQGTYKEINLA